MALRRRVAAASSNSVERNNASNDASWRVHAVAAGVRPANRCSWEGCQRSTHTLVERAPNLDTWSIRRMTATDTSLPHDAGYAKDETDRGACMRRRSGRRSQHARRRCDSLGGALPAELPNLAECGPSTKIASVRTIVARTRARVVAIGAVSLIAGSITQARATADDDASFQTYRATDRVHVYWAPKRVERRGWIETDAVFEAGEPVRGPGCDTWAPVPGGGFACLDDAEPAPGASPGVPAARPDDPLPFLYAARGGDGAFSFAFTKQDTDPDTGRDTLVRPSGHALPASRYELHPTSTFRGRDLLARPIDPDRQPAWSVLDSTPLYAAADDEAEPIGTIPKHTALELALDSADEHGHWYLVVDGLGPGQAVWVDDRQGVRHWLPAPPIDDVGDDELWVDLDLDQQMIALRRGEDVEYVTLVSSGIDSRPTPIGLFRIRDKRAWSSMGSNPSSADEYFIEHVPWTMYFRDYYALHGAYWHDVFGNQRSHGCVNLAPYDAKVLYEALAPRAEPSFMRTYASESAPGSFVRIRRGHDPVPDRTSEGY
jgi:hypothetical protein